MRIPIGDRDPLSADDEIRLARQIEVGVFASHALACGKHPCAATTDELRRLVELGRQAYEEFFLANLPMVALLARKWAHRSLMGSDDLFQEGCLGLASAIMRWDHSRGIKFVTLGWRLVSATMASAALLRCGANDVTPARARAAFQAKRARARLEMELGRSVGTSELADHLGMDAALVGSYLEQGTSSGLDLDELADRTPDTRDALAQFSALSNGWLSRLDRADREILQARYGIGQQACNQVELAARMGVSASTVRRLESRALLRARRTLELEGVA